MKKLNKNRNAVDNSIEAYACVCGCGCSCSCFCFLTIGSADDKADDKSSVSDKASDATFGLKI
jgi:putative bacteriocin precursor